MIRHAICAGTLAVALGLAGQAFAQASAGSSSDQNTSPQQSQQMQSSQSGQSSDQSQAKDMDKLFIKEAAANNQCELQLAQMAQQKSQDQQVKEFAQKMVDDHQKAENELKDIAKKCDVHLSSSLPKDKQEVIDAFQKLQGADFDKHFVSAMKADHARDVSKYSDCAKLAQNQDLKTWVAGKVPTLQQHDQMVMSLAQAQGLSTGMEAQPAGATMQPGNEMKSTTPGQPGQTTPESTTPGSSTPGSTTPGSSGTPGSSSSGTSGSQGSSSNTNR